MSYFNSEQEDYLKSLSKIPDYKRCWCGWYKVEECYNCNKTHPHQTLQDSLNLKIKMLKKDD